MLSLLARALFALAADALCEKIRPTVRYDASWQMKVNDGPWENRSAPALRRPWQRNLRIPLLPPVTPEPDQEVTIRSYVVAPEPPSGGPVFVCDLMRMWGPTA